MMRYTKTLFNVVFLFSILTTATAVIPLPSFVKMKSNYPGYSHAGGHYHNNQLIKKIGCKRDLLLHDTSALRLSYAFNKVGGLHSLGHNLIHLSRNGIDSVEGRDGHQYIFHPISYGPFLADKYGYPSVSKLHKLDAISTKKDFWGKQGIIRVITYRKIKNLPVGHVALWDCDHFHETTDWISGHSLITAEFWESPDSNCSTKASDITESKERKLQYDNHESLLLKSINPPMDYVHSLHQLPVPLDKVTTKINDTNQGKLFLPKDSKTDLKTLLQDKAFRKQFIKKHYVSNGHLRHAKHRGLVVSGVHHG